MYRIGIDLGGTNIAVGLVNEFCRIVTKKSTPTLAKRESDDITADMARLCLEVCAEAKTPITEIESIGIATPGIANLDNGCVEYSCNLPFRRYPIVKKLASMLDIEESKIKIANDANAAAYGEAVAGAARGTSDSIMVTLGTGVGGGIILGGKILTGFNHAAGEIGHIVIEKDGAQCGCGRRGCWEAYSSATALVRMTKEKIEECEKAVGDADPFTAEEIKALAEKAKIIIAERARYYAPMIGVTYNRITIRCQRTRWGSCSSKGNLNFNCLLALFPLEIIDSVVVHELCHRKHMNHSPKFYAEIEKVFPEYKRCNKWLKDNGGLYMARLK